MTYWFRPGTPLEMLKNQLEGAKSQRIAMQAVAESHMKNYLDAQGEIDDMDRWMVELQEAIAKLEGTDGTAGSIPQEA